MDVHTNNRFDIKENKRGYVGTFGLGASTDYTEKLNVAVSADAVVTSPKANEVWGFRKEWALQTFRINLESTYQLTPALYVKPNVMFSTIVDSGIRSDAKTASIDRDVFSGGLALGADF